MSYELDLLMRRAQNGDADAQYDLGERYYDGNGVSENPEKAVYWYKKAADQGHLEAQYSLGWCYKNGEGVATNFTLGAEWLKKAAQRGHAKAQLHLGHSYNDGEGVPENLNTALYWWEKAAEQGNDQAQACTGACYYMQYRNLNKALYWLEKAIDQGNEVAKDMLLVISKDVQKESGSNSSQGNNSTGSYSSYNGGSRELQEKVSDEMGLYGSGTGNKMAIYYDPYVREWRAVDYWKQGYSLKEDVLGASWGTTRFNCSNGKTYTLSTNNPNKDTIYFFFN